MSFLRIATTAGAAALVLYLSGCQSAAAREGGPDDPPPAPSDELFPAEDVIERPDMIGAGNCWDSVRLAAKRRHEAHEGRDEGPPFFLGIRTRRTEEPYQIGVKVEHVFAGSPAAWCGLQVGDEIREIGGKAVRTASELRAVLASGLGAAPVESATPAQAERGQDPDIAAMTGDGQDPRTKPAWSGPTAKLRYSRDGQESAVDLRLVARTTWTRERRERLFDHARLSATSIPFIFRGVVCTIDAPFLKAYYGVEVKEPLEIYRSVEVIPVLSLVTLVRSESLALVDGGGVVVVMWPLRFTSFGEDRTLDLRGLVPPRPAGLEDL